jgi:hypothetical protein
MSVLPIPQPVASVPPAVPDVIEPDYEQFITEDDTPVDNIYSERQHRLLTDALHASWKAPDEQPHLAATDVGLYYAIGEAAIVPDVMVSLGVRPSPDWREKKNRSYFVWVYGKTRASSRERRAIRASRRSSRARTRTSMMWWMSCMTPDCRKRSRGCGRLASSRDKPAFTVRAEQRRSLPAIARAAFDR